jgi:hypothetical protein
MTGLTDFITNAQWEDILTVWYVVGDDAYKAWEATSGPWRQRGPEPEFSDSEVITVALMIETFFHGHAALGLAFLRQYHRELFPQLLPDGQFNERRRALGLITEQIRQVVTHTWGLIEPEDRARLVR